MFPGSHESCRRSSQREKGEDCNSGLDLISQRGREMGGNRTGDVGGILEWWVVVVETQVGRFEEGGLSR